MGALVQTKPSRFALLGAIVAPSRPGLIPARGVFVREPRAFPEAPTRPTLPTFRDEILGLYAFTFCQGGFIHDSRRRNQTSRSAGEPRRSADLLN
jgi:hypothetical protein